MTNFQTAQEQFIGIDIAEINQSEISTSLFHRTEACPCCGHEDKPGVDILNPDTDLSLTSAPADTPESNTIPGDTSTTATITVGESLVETIDFAGDEDWFAIELVAGERYQFDLVANGSSLDPYLELMDASGLRVAFNDDGGPGLNSLLAFTPETSGTYYVNAHDYGDGVGEYTLSVNVVEPIGERTVDEIAHFLTHEYRTPQRFDSSEISYDISTLSTDFQVYARTALDAWADISGLTFVEVSDSADITFQDTAAGAYARNVSSYQGDGDYNTITSSTINVASNWYSASYGDNLLDNYVYQTFIHEIGHAIGLGHAGPYNGAATYSATGSGDNVYLNDSWAFTVMSYFNQTESGYGDYRYVLGPQLADINAIQDLYGTNPEGTNTGNTTYGFNSTEDGIEDWSTFTYSRNDTTSSRPPAMTIYDTGGIDTIDLSGYQTDQTLDLNPGTFSDIGDASVALNQNYTNVIAIEESTLIEVAILGSGNDTVFGNAANNTLTGGFGHDRLFGGAGDDQLIVDFGHDLLTGGSGSDTFTILSTADAASIADFTIGEDTLDLSDFSRETAIAAFENRSYQPWETTILVEGITISLQTNVESLSLSDLLLADPEPSSDYNEIYATAPLEYLRGTEDADAFIFTEGTSTIALGADRILDWAPGDIIDVSALGFTEGDLELVQDGARLRLRQTDGSDDFHAFVFNQLHTIEQVYSAIVYAGSTPPPPPPPVNTAPIAVDDTATTEETAPVAIDVLSNDTDADGDTLNLSGFTQASNGMVTQLANGQLQYVANQGFVGVDTFTYILSDGNGGTDEGEVTVTVEQSGVTPPPTGHNAIFATSTLEYLRGTAAEDSFIFGPNTSNIALGADRILDWAPGDVIDVSAFGFSEGDLELVQDGARLRLRQTDGSDDFHALIFNGEHTIEEIYNAIVYEGESPTPPPPSDFNEITATSALEYLRGTAANDAFIFDTDTSTIALGADRILDWQPGDIIDVTALGFSEGDLELVADGNRFRLRQTDGSDDFHLLIFNGEHTAEEIYAAILYSDRPSAERLTDFEFANITPASEPVNDPFITTFDATSLQYDESISPVSEVNNYEPDPLLPVLQIEDDWALV